MRRINYLLSWSERHAGVALPNAVRPELRAPLAVLACAFGLVLLLWAVQDARLRAAAQDGVRYARQADAAEARLARSGDVERDVASLRALAERLALTRQTGARRAAEIAVLGNALAAESWLTSVHVDPAAISLEGRSARLTAVGATIGNLSRLHAYAAVRLVSLHDDSATSGLTYALALEQRR
ncbi:MAG TPA: hypothetical protein VGD01_02645 [Candidatus Elarobacter sp.]|jgi:hypothetical protein